MRHAESTQSGSFSGNLLPENTIAQAPFFANAAEETAEIEMRDYRTPDVLLEEIIEWANRANSIGPKPLTPEETAELFSRLNPPARFEEILSLQGATAKIWNALDRFRSDQFRFSYKTDPIFKPNTHTIALFVNNLHLDSLPIFLEKIGRSWIQCLYYLIEMLQAADIERVKILSSWPFFKLIVTNAQDFEILSNELPAEKRDAVCKAIGDRLENTEDPKTYKPTTIDDIEQMIKTVDDLSSISLFLKDEQWDKLKPRMENNANKIIKTQSDLLQLLKGFGVDCGYFDEVASILENRTFPNNVNRRGYFLLRALGKKAVNIFFQGQENFFFENKNSHWYKKSTDVNLIDLIRYAIASGKKGFFSLGYKGTRTLQRFQELGITKETLEREKAVGAPLICKVLAVILASNPQTSNSPTHSP